MHAQVAWAQLCANHVNLLSTYHVQLAVWHMVRLDSSAIKFDIVEIMFILTLFYWVKPLTDEGGEETGVLEENPWWQASEMPHTKAWKSKPQAGLKPTL